MVKIPEAVELFTVRDDEKEPRMEGVMMFRVAPVQTMHHVSHDFQPRQGSNVRKPPPSVI